MAPPKCDFPTLVLADYTCIWEIKFLAVRNSSKQTEQLLYPLSLAHLPPQIFLDPPMHTQVRISQHTMHEHLTQGSWIIIFMCTV